MITALTWALIAMTGLSLTVICLGVWSARRHFAARKPELLADEQLPPLTFLKPIKGLEEELEKNLESLFRQDYPKFEVIFASTEPDDLGIWVAQRVAARFPDVQTKFVLSDPNFGMNPKVANLAGADAHASYDLALISDANVRLEPGYARAIVSELLAHNAQLLTSPVIGDGEVGFGAAIENIQLTSFIAPGMCTALHVGGVACVVGKAMLFRRSELDSLGGLEMVRDFLCEDFVIGQRYAQENKKVLLSRTPVRNINKRIPLEQFLSRHSRWLKMRVVLHVGGFIADICSNPNVFAALAWVTSGFDAEVGLFCLSVAGLKLYIDAHLMRTIRGRPMEMRYLALAPIKDLLMGLVWLHACFSRTVIWRGKVLHFGRHSKLIKAGPLALPATSTIDD